MLWRTLQFEAVLLVTAGVVALASTTQAQSKPSNPRVTYVETSVATLTLRTTSCDLVGVAWKEPKEELIQEPRLGENFRLLLPRPGYEAAYFDSRDQSGAELTPAPDAVSCRYRKLRAAQDVADVDVTYSIRAIEHHLEFSIDVENRTDRPLAEVYFGILGGQQGLGARENTESLVPGLNYNAAPKLFTKFRGGGYGGGNLGIPYSGAGFTYPGWDMTMPWMEIFNRKTNVGLYYGNHDLETRLTGTYFELRPFEKTAVTSDNWPTAADVPAGEPIGLTMGWLNFPYTKKGSFHAGPVVLELHRGDWHEGSRIYRAWFDQHFPPPHQGWLRNEQAWQSVILSNPEDVISYRFSDLPRLAADAKKYGVTTFEILGWDVGGIDRGYPQYTPNPRLGTPQEFHDALTAIKKLGVHPVIFGNVQYADTATPLYKRELSQYAVHGRWADDLQLYGWGEGTVSARMGLARSNMTLTSPSHPAFRKLLTDQFTELVRDGAEGFQLDKGITVHFLDFNPRVPVSPDRSLPDGLLKAYADILQEGRKVNPELALAAEVWWDRAFPYIDVSYVRMSEIDMPSTALRYTFPEWTSTIFAENPADFNVMSNGMRYGLVWALAPRHYSASMDEVVTRPLSRYVQELIRIRKAHEDLLFHGRFLDTDGATVTGDADIRYSVFEPLHGGSAKAVVVVNYAPKAEHASVVVPGREDRAAEILTPFAQTRTAKLPLDLLIAPQSCVVLVVQ